MNETLIVEMDIFTQKNQNLTNEAKRIKVVTMFSIAKTESKPNL